MDLQSFEIVGLLLLKKNIFIIHGYGGHLGHLSQQEKKSDYVTV